MNDKSINKIKELKEYFDKIKPIQPEFLKKLDRKFRLEFNYNSNHLEGNTLTYGETKLFLIFGDDAKLRGDHTLREYNEMKAHDVALQLIKEWSCDKNYRLKEIDIKNLNKIILVEPFFKDAITDDGQKTRRKIDIGNYKKFPNSVLTSAGEVFEYASVIDVPILMRELIDWYYSEEQKKSDPIILAALFHYKFVRIHPFDDGNGRLARLLMNYILLKNDYPMIVIKSDDKKNYLSALRNADSGDVDFFVNYIAKQAQWSLNLCIKAAKGEEIEEEEDLKKEVSLIKKEIEIKSKKVRTSKDLSLIWDASLSLIIKRFLEKFSTFDDLFYKTETRFVCLVGDEGLKLESFEKLDDFCKKYNEKPELTKISVGIEFSGFGVKFGQCLEIKFDTIFYEIKTFINASREVNIEESEAIATKKSYNEVLNSQEVEEMIDGATKSFLKAIKKQQNINL